MRLQDSTEQETIDLPGFRLSPDVLTDRTWCLSNGRGGVFAPYVRLLPNGRVTGEQLPDARRWALEDGRLALWDDLGRKATSLSQTGIGRDGRLRLAGVSRDGAAWEMEEIEPLRDMADAEDVALISRGPPTGRRYLVVLRANEQSLHTQWARDIDDSDRTWDLCISFYGKESSFTPEGWQEYSVLQNKERKFIAIQKLFYPQSPLWAYDYVMFPDDDLMMTWRDINIMFEICREYELDLAQPSLHHDGVINYHETKQNKNFLLRYLSMVEAMAPIMSQGALRVCLPTFSLNETAWGIDYAWSKLVAGPATRIAIIDKVTVLHTRFTGVNYPLEVAYQEGLAAASRFGPFTYTIKELGGVFAEPISLADLRREYFAPEIAHLESLLGDAYQLKTGWYEPEIDRLRAEVARLTELLAGASELKTGWYEPELVRLGGEVRRLSALSRESET